MTTSPLANGTRVASIALITLLSTAVATALIGGLISGFGGSSGAPAARPAGQPVGRATVRAATITTPAPVAVATPRPLRFSWQVHRVSAVQLGKSWHAGCPVGPSSLRVVTFTHWDFDGKVRTGRIVLHQDVVAGARKAFRTMYQRRFPLRQVHPVSAYAGDDDRSMAADNTSAFNCRKAVAAGTPSWSRHAYGKAIDVNPVENPYLFQGDVLPPAGKAYTDRRKARPGLIRKGDRIYGAFLAAGFRWGGAFSNPDYQHFDR